MLVAAPVVRRRRLPRRSAVASAMERRSQTLAHATPQRVPRQRAVPLDATPARDAPLLPPCRSCPRSATRSARRRPAAPMRRPRWSRSRVDTSTSVLATRNTTRSPKPKQHCWRPLRSSSATSPSPPHVSGERHNDTGRSGPELREVRWPHGQAHAGCHGQGQVHLRRR